MKQSLANKQAVVVGGSRGLGLGMVEALRESGAVVTVVARDETCLADVERRLGVAVEAGDASDAAFAERLLARVRPEVLIVNAGVVSPMGVLSALSWDDFSRVWNADVKISFHWVQAALRLPLPKGSKVLLTSSGASLRGSPLSGGYAGAKRMQWLMANYANVEAEGLGLGLHFQAILPMQMIGGTGIGDAAAEKYAARQGKSVAEFLAGFGAPMLPRKLGEHVVEILTQPAYARGTAFGVKGDTGITSLDA